MNSGKYGLAKNRTYEKITSSSYATSASYALTASYVANVATTNPTTGYIPYNNGGTFANSIISQQSGYINISGSGNFTNGLIVTGSIRATSFTGSFSGSLVGYIPASQTASLATTGSNQFNGNQTITGSLQISASLMETIVVSGLGSGTTTIFQRATGSYTAALAKYTVNKSTNARAGEFMTVWNGNTIVSTDISTADIGNTSDLTFSASLAAGQINTSTVAGTSGWNVKMLITYI
jgi:hypothetical protein